MPLMSMLCSANNFLFIFFWISNIIWKHRYWLWLATFVTHVPSILKVKFSWMFDLFKTWMTIVGWRTSCHVIFRCANMMDSWSLDSLAKENYFVIQNSRLISSLPFLLLGIKGTPLTCKINFLMAFCVIGLCDYIS